MAESTVVQGITKTNTLNVSGMLYAKSNQQTPFLDAIYSRGRGTRKVNSEKFTLASTYALDDGTQPAISEDASIAGAQPETTQRGQDFNVIQIYQKAAEVSYLKQSTVGSLSGLNVQGQLNNVQNELDFQIARRVEQIKKDLNYTTINGVYHESTGTNDAWKSRGIVNAITTNKVDASSQAFDKKLITTAVNSAIANGFTWVDGKMEMWVNPSMLETINDAFSSLAGFGTPASRTEGGIAITTLYTYFGSIDVYYDAMFPTGTILIANMGELAIAELDVPNKGCWFYEDIAKQGASQGGQIYGQAGLDYGAEQAHILITGVSGEL